MGRHEMIIPDASGHTSVTWDPAVADEVEVAESTFDDMVGKGYRAFKMTGSGEQGARMDTFDPKAAKVMFVPQLRGG
jgi:hypothetical protein